MEHEPTRFSLKPCCPRLPDAARGRCGEDLSHLERRWRALASHDQRPQQLCDASLPKHRTGVVLLGCSSNDAARCSAGWNAVNFARVSNPGRTIHARLRDPHLSTSANIAGTTGLQSSSPGTTCYKSAGRQSQMSMTIAAPPTGRCSLAFMASGGIGWLWRTKLVLTPRKGSPPLCARRTGKACGQYTRAGHARAGGCSKWLLASSNESFPCRLPRPRPLRVAV